jgi:hypothetical protein
VAAPATTSVPDNATFLISAPASTKGAYAVTINGVSGANVKRSIDVSLTVNAPTNYSLTMSPGAYTIDSSSTATYDVAVAGNSTYTGTVALALSGCPKAAACALSGSTIASGLPATLRVTPDAAKTPSGTYTIVVTGSVPSKPDQTAQASLVITDSKGTPFTIRGDVGGLMPSTTGTPIDLELSNPNSKALSVTSLTVTFGTLTAPNATPDNSCSLADDFVLKQYSGPLPLVIPANGTVTLTDLGVSDADWPAVQLKQADRNQDGCKSARINLNYAGSATGL